MLFHSYAFGDNRCVVLAAGAHIVIVKNRTAFALRYDTGNVNLAPGAYTGNLSCQGALKPSHYGRVQNQPL